MELPHVGKSCGKTDCSRLDFLPFTCDLCKKVFCQDHREYNDHSCPEQYKVDSQVPVCPKCGEIIPIKPGDDPNYKVNAHIENNCSKMPKIKTYPNRCNKRGCKKKEAIPVSCKTCKINFCLAHRFEQDHDCQGFVHPLARNNGQFSKSNSSTRTAPSKAGSTTSRQQMADDEALARSLAQEEDEALARALQASLMEEQRGGVRQHRQQQPQQDSGCSVS